MCRYPDRAAITAVVLATAWSVAGSTVLTGCSSGSDDTGTAESAQQPSVAPTSTETGLPETSASSGAVGVSPEGITTSVEAPAESTEREYFEACHAALVWMKGQQGDRQAQIEPYLSMLQTSSDAGPATFNTPWAQLPPGRQSAVIVAVQAAADDLCA